jgi:hypothetical protein
MSRQVAVIKYVSKRNNMSHPTATTNQNIVCLFRVKLTCGFLGLVPAASSGGLTIRQKGKILLLVPEMADSRLQNLGSYALPVSGLRLPEDITIPLVQYYEREQ